MNRPRGVPFPQSLCGRGSAYFADSVCLLSGWSEEKCHTYSAGRSPQHHSSQMRSGAPLLRMGLVSVSRRNSHFPGLRRHAGSVAVIVGFCLLTALSFSAKICAELPTVAQADRHREAAGIILLVVTSALGSLPPGLWARGPSSRAPARGPTEHAGDPGNAVCFLF